MGEVPVVLVWYCWFGVSLFDCIVVVRGFWYGYCLGVGGVGDVVGWVVYCGVEFPLGP